MKFENTQVFGLENAIIGLRLPMSKDLVDAQNKSDSFLCTPLSIPDDCKHCQCCNNDECECTNDNNSDFIIGEKDMKVCKSLITADSVPNKTGTPNSKFLRMIHCQVAITAPLYWWKEFDTYKVGTTANSTSTMHKLASTPITSKCFEFGDFDKPELFDSDIWVDLIKACERLRVAYIDTKDKRYWKELIRLLPESWLQTRMCDLDYQTLRNMISWRTNHKLSEWSVDFINWCKTLPYADEFLF